MPVKCFNKPQRTKRRFWTAKKVGEVGCLAIREGSTLSEIEAELAKCARRDRQPVADEAVAALINAAQALEQTNLLFDADAAFLERFQGLGVALGVAFRLIARFYRPAAALSVVTTTLLKLADGRLTEIAVRKAANEAAARIARQAAANAARFRQTGT